MLSHLAVVPFALAVAFVAAALFSRYPWHRGRRLVLCLLIPVAILTAVIPNAGQRMYDFGLSMAAIDILEAASLYLFVFATTGAWTLLAPDRRRWLLVILVPVAFFEWSKWTLAFVLWGIRGFAP